MNVNLDTSHTPIGDPLWIDESILVVSKPAGLLTIRDGFRPEIPFLAQMISQQFGPIWVVHRLDRDTSGLVLFARSADVHRHLNRQFQNREVKKVYRAIVHHHPQWEEFRADFPLRVNSDRKHRTIIDPINGKPAVTSLQVIRRFEQNWSLLTAQPHSGYTHQIRAHVAWLGHPIANDPLYRLPKNSPYAPASSPDFDAPLFGIDRLALHASSIEFHHPILSRTIEVTAPDPPDFARALAVLH